MAHKKADLVQELSTAGHSGTAPLTLAGATQGNFPVSGDLANGDTAPFQIRSNANPWEVEVSLCTYNSGSNTLTRSTVYKSSAGGALVNFSAGAKTVTLVAPASKMVVQDPGGNASVTGKFTGQSLEIQDQHTFYSVDTGTMGLRIGAAGPYFSFRGSHLDGVIPMLSGGGTFAFGINGVERMRLTGNGLSISNLTPVDGTTSTLQTDGDVSIKGDPRAISGNIYYAGGYKYYGNGYGFSLRSSGTGRLDLYGFANNVAGANAAATPLALVGFDLLAGHFQPLLDNSSDNGGPSNRWRVVYAATGTINTSDGREKHEPRVLTEAEVRVGRRLARLVRIWRYNDAIAEKGIEAARLHSGWVAQDVMAAFTAEGADPFRFGCVGFDLLEKTEPYEVMVWRDKIETYDDDEDYIDIVNGAPMLLTRTVPKTRVAGTMKEVRNAFNEVVMIPSAEKDGEGNSVPVPMMHFVAEREEVPEPRTRRVPDLDENNEQRQRLNVRPFELVAFVIAAQEAVLTSLEEQIAALG